MDRITILRTILATSLFSSAILWRVLIDDPLERNPWAMRLLDELYFWFAMWGCGILIWASFDGAGATFVRDWLSWVLPPLVFWPVFRFWVAYRRLKRKLEAR